MICFMTARVPPGMVDCLYYRLSERQVHHGNKTEVDAPPTWLDMFTQTMFIRNKKKSEFMSLSCLQVTASLRQLQARLVTPPLYLSQPTFVTLNPGWTNSSPPYLCLGHQLEARLDEPLCLLLDVSLLHLIQGLQEHRGTHNSWYLSYPLFQGQQEQRNTHHHPTFLPSHPGCAGAQRAMRDVILLPRIKAFTLPHW
eukprot:1123972-Pelagomonas_calceolata.AAC.2